MRRLISRTSFLILDALFFFLLNLSPFLHNPNTYRACCSSPGSCGIGEQRPCRQIPPFSYPRPIQRSTRKMPRVFPHKVLLFVMLLAVALCAIAGVSSVAALSSENACVFPNSLPLGNTIDLSALQTQTFTTTVSRPSNTPGDVDEFTYRFDFCGVSSEPNCGTHNNASICQYQVKTGVPNDLAASLGSWVQEPRPVAKELYRTMTDGQLSERYGVEVTFVNGGDQCWYTSKDWTYRTTRLTIMCPPAGGQGVMENAIVVEDYTSELCTYVATLYNKIACDPNQNSTDPISPQDLCTFPDVGLDLYSILNDTTVTFADAIAKQFTYNMTFCAPSSDAKCAAAIPSLNSTAGGTGALCQYHTFPNNTMAFNYALGSWSGSPKPVVTWYAANETTSAEQLHGKWSLFFDNTPANCQNRFGQMVPRTTTLWLECGAEFATTPIEESHSYCEYTATLTHPGLCEQHPPTPPPTPQPCYFPEFNLNLTTIFGDNTTVTLKDAWAPQFVYNITLCGVSTDPFCGFRENSSICQYDTMSSPDGLPRVNTKLGSFVAEPLPTMKFIPNVVEMMKGWKVMSFDGEMRLSALEEVTTSNNTNNTGTYVLSFSNTNVTDCLNRMGEWVSREMTLFFQCGPEESYSVVTESYTFCQYSATITHPKLCNIPPEPEPEPKHEFCDFPEVGLMLSEMFPTNTTFWAKGPGGQYNYTLTMCGVTEEPVCAALNASICQYQSTKFIRDVAGWGNDPRPVAVYNNATVVGTTYGEWVVKFANGGMCLRSPNEIIPAETVVTMKCPKDGITTHFTAAEHTRCLYEMTLEHAEFCKFPPDDDDHHPTFCDLNSTRTMFPPGQNTFVGYSTGGQYKYTMTVCGVSPDPQCAAKNTSLCQYDAFEGGIFLRNIASWFNSPLPTAFNTTVVNKEMEFHFANGDLCERSAGQLIPAEALVKLRCPADGKTEKFVTEEHTRCLYEMTLDTLAMCQDDSGDDDDPTPIVDNCNFPDLGLDLRQVFPQPTTFVGHSTGGQYKYTMTLCGVSQEPQCAAKNTSLCQYDEFEGGIFLRNIGTWFGAPLPVGRVTDVKVPSSSSTTSTATANTAKEWVFQFANGDLCNVGPMASPVPREALVTLRCPSDGVTMSFSTEEHIMCVYEMVLEHPALCNVTTTTPVVNNTVNTPIPDDAASSEQTKPTENSAWHHINPMGSFIFGAVVFAMVAWMW